MKYPHTSAEIFKQSMGGRSRNMMSARLHTLPELIPWEILGSFINLKIQGSAGNKGGGGDYSSLPVTFYSRLLDRYLKTT
jgi:hypothetical protein